MTTVLVCGGRDFDDWRLLSRVLDALDLEYGFTYLVHGAARGADEMAMRWGMGRLPVGAEPAEWDKHGRRAGPIRNQKMLDEYSPDLVVAFPGGRGTADMVRRAKKAGVRVIEVTT